MRPARLLTGTMHEHPFTSTALCHATMARTWRALARSARAQGELRSARILEKRARSCEASLRSLADSLLTQGAE